jgi:hypothetical protein
MGFPNQNNVLMGNHIVMNGFLQSPLPLNLTQKPQCMGSCKCIVLFPPDPPLDVNYFGSFPLHLNSMHNFTHCEKISVDSLVPGAESILSSSRSVYASDTVGRAQRGACMDMWVGFGGQLQLSGR